MKFLPILLVTVFSQISQAYPELIRYGYNNCQVCHVSPAGGGTLTSYGRSLSSEVLSTWGTEKEAGFLHGAVDREKFEQWLLMGGDVRGVQTYSNNDVAKSGHFYKMQSDLSAAIAREKWTVTATLGSWEKQANSSDYSWKAKFTSYYALYRPVDQLTLRVGRFIPQYGIHIHDHIYFIRSNLDFGITSQRDTAEVQWTGEDWTFLGSYSTGSDSYRDEKAFTLQVQRYFAERFKVAANYWRSSGNGSSRDLYGAWALLGFTKRLFLLTEIDWQKVKTPQTATNNFVAFTKFGYTFVKGFDGLILAEKYQADIGNSSTKTERYGVGFQFFPRPHFEISGNWYKQKQYAVSNHWGDYAWLQLHYYF